MSEEIFGNMNDKIDNIKKSNDDFEVFIENLDHWSFSVFVKNSVMNLVDKKIFSPIEFKFFMEEISPLDKLRKIAINTKFEIFDEEFAEIVVENLPSNKIQFVCSFLKNKQSFFGNFLLKKCLFFLQRKNDHCFLLELGKINEVYSEYIDKFIKLLLKKLLLFENKYNELHLFFENDEFSHIEIHKQISSLIVASRNTLTHLSIFFIATFSFDKNSNWKQFCEVLENLVEYENLESLTLCFENNQTNSNGFLIALSFVLKFLFLYQQKISKLAFYYKASDLNFVALEALSDNLEIILPKMTDISICLSFQYPHFLKLQLDSFLTSFMNGITVKIKRLTFCLQDEDYDRESALMDSVLFDEDSMATVLEGIRKTQLSEFNIFLHTKPGIASIFWKNFLLELTKGQKMLIHSKICLSLDEKGEKMLKIYSENIKTRRYYLYIAFSLKKKVKKIYGRIEPLCEILNWFF